MAPDSFRSGGGVVVSFIVLETYVPQLYSRLEMNEYILNALIGCLFLYFQLLDISESKVKCAKREKAGVGNLTQT